MAEWHFSPNFTHGNANLCKDLEQFRSIKHLQTVVLLLYISLRFVTATVIKRMHMMNEDQPFTLTSA